MLFRDIKIFIRAVAMSYLLLIINTLSASAQSGIRGDLRGRVLDSLGHAIAGASVSLFPDEHLRITDKQGFFTFNNLIAGRYQIVVQALNHASYSDRVDIVEKQLTRLELALEKAEKQLEEVQIKGHYKVVDNLLKAGLAGMPVKVVSRAEIESMGSRRLDEVMKEQTGVAVVNDISGGARATGVQVQGFSSNYIMVLIDGQPMMGRNSGNFDLSRISVANIERIEIIKGASSCLYGSDAMGGAINIITRHGATQAQAQAAAFYGSQNTVDATVEGEAPFSNNRGSIVLSANYYQTDGFNTDRGQLLSRSTTFPPYSNYSLQGRVRFAASAKGILGLSARYAARESEMMQAWAADLALKDNQNDQDLNAALSYDHQWSEKLRTMSRYYITRFKSDMQARWLEQGIEAAAEEFGQTNHRLEQQFSYQAFRGLSLTGGLGGSIELMDNAALDAERRLRTAFAFLQSEWIILQPLRATVGLRYDQTNVYNGRISPSAGLQYQLTEKLLLKAGTGAGFKAPDYKMLYQVFYNPTANYLVVGNERLRGITDEMYKNGELSDRNSYLVNLLAGNLKAEKSWSNHLGLTWNPRKNLRAEVSLFYHRIKDQINAVNVGTGTSVSQIYTYRNLPSVENRGLEFSMNYQLSKDLNVSLGYQYLEAKDRSVVDSIRAGRYPYNQYNNARTGEYRASRESDYWGIEDRSRHMLNLKAHYTYAPWKSSISIRANYRGKYPFQETNGNQFIDDGDKFVPYHTLVNLTLDKRILQDRVTFRVVADNLFDFTSRYMLGQPGRVMMAGLTYRFYQDQQKGLSR